MADGDRDASVADRDGVAAVALGADHDLAGHRVVDAAQLDQLGPRPPRVGEQRVGRVGAGEDPVDLVEQVAFFLDCGWRQRTSSHIRINARFRRVCPSVVSAHHGVMSVATRVSVTAASSQASSRGPRTVAIAPWNAYWDVPGIPIWSSAPWAARLARARTSVWPSQAR